MKETLAMSSARTAPMLLQNLILMNLKFLGMSAKDVALSQIICRTGLIAGAVTAGLRCNSGRATNVWHSAMAAIKSSTIGKSTAGTAGKHGRHPRQSADCLCPTSLVNPELPQNWRRRRRSGRQCRRRRRWIAAPRQRRQSRSQIGHSPSSHAGGPS